MLVPKYLSVFSQLYLRKRGQLLYQRIMQPFLRNTMTFNGEGVLPYLGMVERFRCDDPRFCDIGWARMKNPYKDVPHIKFSEQFRVDQSDIGRLIA